MKSAPWAFIIWDIMYTLIFGFGIYTVIPLNCLRTRNNDLIYNQIGPLFVINIFCNGTWIYLSQIIDIHA